MEAYIAQLPLKTKEDWEYMRSVLEFQQKNKECSWYTDCKKDIEQYMKTNGQYKLPSNYTDIIKKQENMDMDDLDNHFMFIPPIATVSKTAPPFQVKPLKTMNPPQTESQPTPAPQPASQPTPAAKLSPTSVEVPPGMTRCTNWTNDNAVHPWWRPNFTKGWWGGRRKPRKSRKRKSRKRRK